MESIIPTGRPKTWSEVTSTVMVSKTDGEVFSETVRCLNVDFSLPAISGGLRCVQMFTLWR